MKFGNKKPEKIPMYVYYIIAGVIIVLLNMLVVPAVQERSVQKTDYSTFIENVEDGNVTKATVEENYIYYEMKDSNSGNMVLCKTVKMDDSDLVNRLLDAGVTMDEVLPESPSILMTLLLSYVVPIVIFIFIGRWLSKKIMSSMGGGPGGAMSFGKSNAKVYVKSSTGIKFSDVAGEDEAKDLLTEIVDYLHNPQKYTEIGASMPKGALLVGPPGTGKTYNSATYAVAICDGKSVNELTDYNAVMKRYNELKEAGRIAFTTFHQSYGYEEFIEGIKPVVDDEATDISYTIESGVFKKFCDVVGTPENMEIDHNAQVWNEKPYVFIIDEINRGNISKIFGELITLIESTKRAGMEEAASAILPYSGKPFSVPSNVYILGTMNTADRSIALMDTALRRRFQFIEMMPDSDVLRKIHADKVEDLDVAAVLDKINERITFLYDREHTIGHAFFTGLKDDASLAKLQSIFEKSVIPLLQEYFYEDYQKIQLVLGDNAKSDDSLKFILDEKVVAKNIFKGNAEDVIDLPEKRYSINKAAFGNINSYKEIL